EIEGGRERDVELGVVLWAREPERLGAVALENRHLVLREEHDVEPPRRAERNPARAERRRRRTAEEAGTRVGVARRDDDVAVPMELLEVGAVGMVQRQSVDDDAGLLIPGREVQVVAGGVDGHPEN